MPVVTTTLMDFEKGEVGSQAYVPESEVCARVMMSEVTMSWILRLITMVPTRLRSWVMIWRVKKEGGSVCTATITLMLQSRGE